MKIDYEKFGICVTIAVVACLCGLAGIASSNIDLSNIIPSNGESKIPFPTSSTKTDSNSAYFEWCDKMNFEC